MSPTGFLSLNPIIYNSNAGVAPAIIIAAASIAAIALIRPHRSKIRPFKIQLWQLVQNLLPGELFVLQRVHAIVINLFFSFP